MKHRAVGLVLVGLILGASCSSSTDGAESTAVPDATTADTPAVSDPPTTTTTTPAAVAVPAGVNWTSSTLAPTAPTGAALPEFDQVTASAGVPPAPPGFPFRASDYIGRLFSLGDVQLATGSCSCWEGGDSTGVFGGLRTPIYLFRSVDAGATWAQVDLSGAVGDVNGQIESVIEQDGALLMTATISDARGATPTVIAVLRSADGASWERVTTIAGDGAVPVHAFDMYSLGASLLLAGADMACEFDGASAIQNIAPTYQMRLWTSTDGGVTWLAQSPSDTGLDAGRPPLPDTATCAGLSISEVTNTYGSSPRLITLVGDRVMVWSEDGQRIASSVDGISWSTATLDGVVALPSESVAEPEANSQASTIVVIDGQYIAMNLEQYRTIDDSATGSSIALSVLTWTSTDGQTWQRQPLGRPIVAPDAGASYRFFVSDGRPAFEAFNRLDGVAFGVYESVPGDAEDWTKCVSGPQANCAFSTDVSTFEPGADLSGIDLSFASLEGRDLTDVSFAGARLRGTNLAGTTLNRTNFDGAELSTLSLSGDLTTSTFDGANLRQVRFDDSFFSVELVGATIVSPRITISDSGLPAGVSMVGRDLTEYEFTDGTLAGVDFSGANLTGASFSHTDLSGAVFAGAVLDGVFFYEVTCPDGQPTSDGTFGPSLCRL